MDAPDGPLITRLRSAGEQLCAEPGSSRISSRVVDLAGGVVPAAEFVSVTVVRPPGRFATAAANGPVPEQVDATQYRLREGPCVAAVSTGETIDTPDLLGDARWPNFRASTVVRDHVRSMLLIPLRAGPDVLGSVNFSSARSAAFREPSCSAASVLSTFAALALAVTLRLERAAGSAEQRDQMAGALGYELRNQMTVIMNTTEVLADRRAHLDRRGQEALDLLVDEVGRHHRLLLGLLDLAHTRDRAAARR